MPVESEPIPRRDPQPVPRPKRNTNSDRSDRIGNIQQRQPMGQGHRQCRGHGDRYCSDGTNHQPCIHDEHRQGSGPSDAAGVQNTHGVEARHSRCRKREHYRHVERDDPNRHGSIESFFPSRGCVVQPISHPKRRKRQQQNLNTMRLSHKMSSARPSLALCCNMQALLRRTALSNSSAVRRGRRAPHRTSTPGAICVVMGIQTAHSRRDGAGVGQWSPLPRTPNPAHRRLRISY